MSYYCSMHYVILFGFFDIIQNIYVIDTHVCKYMHMPCCVTFGILKSVDIHVQMK